MFLIRWILGSLILFFDKVFSPKPMRREPKLQQEIDKQTEALILYQFEACPFCVKVRRQMKRLSINIKTRDAKKSIADRQELLKHGGKIKVPCLKISDPEGETRWMYESSDINAYLHDRFFSQNTLSS